MKILWSEKAWEDYLYWQHNDLGILEKINALVKDTQRNPFKGIGKPEPLKHELKGYWSRRITGEHRLVYKVTDEQIVIASCNYHYE